jgi:hypothetical protein
VLVLTPCSRVLLQKQKVTQLVKKFLTFYRTRRCITVFKQPATGLYPEPDVPSPHLLTLFLWDPLILCSHLRLGLPSGLSPWDFSIKILYEFLISSSRATCPAHIVLHYLIFFFLIFLMPFSGVGFFLFTYGSFIYLVGLLGWGISPAPRPIIYSP